MISLTYPTTVSDEEIAIPKHRSTEKAPLCPLNDLLIYRVCRVIHQHRSLLVVEFSIHSRVPDQVDDPLLSLVLVQAQTCG